MSGSWRRKVGAVLAAGAVVAAAGCSGSAQDERPEDYPSQDLEWTIAFGPGGGNDIMARTIVDILQRHRLYPHDIIVENREGGSGSTGWGHVFSQAGSGYAISTTFLASRTAAKKRSAAPPPTPPATRHRAAPEADGSSPSE